MRAGVVGQLGADAQERRRVADLEQFLARRDPDLAQALAEFLADIGGLFDLGHQRPSLDPGR
jgi:hypothetical protein